jgi:formylmethanofuran dehydrogenase subunit B
MTAMSAGFEGSVAYVRGRPCSLEEGVAAAAELLCGARFPLVFGLVDSTVEAQREATRIADRLGGVLDPATSAGHLDSLHAFERLGVLTLSLGEIRGRADLVIFWGCDPDGAHPGFVEHYAPARSGRVRMAIDLGEARGPAGADERLSLPPERELEALLVLCALVRGRRIEGAATERLALPLEDLRRLARRLLRCRYGALLHDADPPPERRDPERSLALGSLVRAVSRRGRLRLLGVRRPGNPVGAENVLTWQTGFPSAVSFARGYPRYGPLEFTAEAVLIRRDVDAALVVGGDPLPELSPPARERLLEIPIVRVSPPDVPGLEATRVFMATAPLSRTRGTVFRMDGVALRRGSRGGESEIWDGLPAEADVLARIAAAVEARRFGGTP